MEQKQLDELDDSFFGEEFVDEENSQLNEKTGKGVRKENSRQAKKVSKKIRAAKKTDKVDDFKTVLEDEKEGEIKIEPAKETAPATLPPKIEPWKDEEDAGKGLFQEISTWRVIAGMAIILLIFSFFTQGFRFSSPETEKPIGVAQAGEKVLSYVNNNLLQPPFVASLEASEDLGILYKVSLTVAGREVDSYVTKDGKYFFPQGFELDTPFPELGKPEEARAVEVSVDDDPAKGDSDAPVTIVEFSDFQCPLCKRYVDSVYPLIIQEYVNKGQVKYVFRDFPLSFHPQAKAAAMAAECADEQGKFWEYHDLLFANQASLNPDDLKKGAADLGLNTEQFNRCFDSEKYAGEVGKDFEDGQNYGVTGTPAFFINGKLISGAQPFAVFKAEIEAALARAGERETATTEATVTEVSPAEESGTEGEVTGSTEAASAPIEIEEAAPHPVKEFTLKAKKWLFSPNKMTVKKGDQIKLNINPEDLIFTFVIPNLGITKEVSGNTLVEFTADKEGTFEFKCSSCEEWRGMTGTLVVE